MSRGSREYPARARFAVPVSLLAFGSPPGFFSGSESVPAPVVLPGRRSVVPLLGFQVASPGFLPRRWSRLAHACATLALHWPTSCPHRDEVPGVDRIADPLRLSGSTSGRGCLTSRSEQAPLEVLWPSSPVTVRFGWRALAQLAKPRITSPDAYGWSPSGYTRRFLGLTPHLPESARYEGSALQAPTRHPTI